MPHKTHTHTHTQQCQLPDAPKVFEALKQAMTDLEEEKVRTRLAGLLQDARDEVYARHRIKADPTTRATVDMDVATTKPLIVQEIRVRLVELQRETIRRAQVKYANEHGRTETNLIKAARQTQERKQMDKAWEEARESRMGNWQSFLAKGKKKSKTSKTKSASSSIFKGGL
jgi:DnaJ family protein C protein 8